MKSSCAYYLLKCERPYMARHCKATQSLASSPTLFSDTPWHGMKCLFWGGHLLLLSLDLNLKAVTETERKPSAFLEVLSLRVINEVTVSQNMVTFPIEHQAPHLFINVRFEITAHWMQMTIDCYSLTPFLCLRTPRIHLLHYLAPRISFNFTQRLKYLE